MFKSRRDHFFVTVTFKSEEAFNHRVEISALIAVNLQSHGQKLESVGILKGRTGKTERISIWVVLMGMYPWLLWDKSEQMNKTYSQMTQDAACSVLPLSPISHPVYSV